MSSPCDNLQMFNVCIYLLPCIRLILYLSCGVSLELPQVEIIGDAYFCVSGCPDRREDHAEKMASAALELLAVIPKLCELANNKFDIRVGMHVGPVVAGVVGLKDPRYHVFGDSVALANHVSILSSQVRCICQVLTNPKTACTYTFVSSSNTDGKPRGGRESALLFYGL